MIITVADMMLMPLLGLGCLLVAFAAVAVSLLCLAAGHLAHTRSPKGSAWETLSWGGHIGVIVTFVALTAACGVLVFCFLSGENSIEYVVSGRSHAGGLLGDFYRFAGLWEGKEGSLLFWAWLISLFATVIAVRDLKKLDRLDTAALFIMQMVLVGFTGILLFSEDNMPFTAIDPTLLNADGSLTAAGSILGMNTLLEHWAMAVHPPALFTGYAGLTVPFAYALAAIIVNDSTDTWVRRAQRYTIVAWLFLGIGIGLGSVWAYVVLGWGGYWGWDAVENASLLPWLVGVALIHSFTVYAQRGAFKRWSVVCACLTFAFSIVGTFISRSGLVESVHAFSGDTVSLVLFGGLIIVAVAAGVVGVLLRWKSFAPDDEAVENASGLLSRDSAYYFNNVLMFVFAVLLTYLTVSSALPGWLPFGGRALSAGTYDAVARPIGILYLAVLAVCPLLGWATTDRAAFLKKAKIPAICALVLFCALLALFFLKLSPNYDAIIAAGGSAATDLAGEGPVWYYKGLAIVGFAVASLLFFNMLFAIVRASARRGKREGTGTAAGFVGLLTRNVATLGGYIAHLGMAVILVGLIGSSMFVLEKNAYVEFDQATDTGGEMQVGDYTLKYTGNSIIEDDNGIDIHYIVEFDAFRGDTFIGHVAPAMQMAQTTQQTKSNAAVISMPDEDLFVVYQGVNSAGTGLSMDVRVNPLIMEVWIGFGLLMLGAAVAAFGRRSSRHKVGVRKAAASKTDAEAEPVAADSAKDADGR